MQRMIVPAKMLEIRVTWVIILRLAVAIFVSLVRLVNSTLLTPILVSQTQIILSKTPGKTLGTQVT
jgi:hypothetical protein